MKNLFFVICIVLITVAASCSQTDTITCADGQLNIAATGFSNADLDSAIAIRYKPDNAFDSLIDTSKIYVQHNTSDTAYMMPHFTDTVSGSAVSSNPYFLKGYDYKIYLPHLARWYSITNITLAGNTHQTITHQRGDLLAYGCTNKVISCAINGNNVPVVYNPGSANQVAQVYISK